ncbi:HupE/UreJ family protein [Methylocystis sp. WRRC1]|uniref:HupE/UreJ family protein n=1 Tax=Methylocystis sp. WRRC1 TaxID=1732014 RepID=UPI001D13F85C|nr:HupE/UreJ family protein [Methylocystis sp. WRRC1]MCC3246479.1 HupE/UreJ family protein [Methylocystis sp. WRRC1]
MARSMGIAVAALWAMIFLVTAAAAHTADISSSRIVPEGNGHYRVDVGFLGTDIERMFAENKKELKDIDLTEPGVIEAMIGKFIQKRVALQNEEGQTCPSTVVSVGEDPTNPYDSKAILRMDCTAVPGQIFYNPFELLKAQGPRAKHLVSIGEKDDASALTEAQRMGREPAPGQVMIYPGDSLIDLSKPLLSPWRLAPKFFAAGIEHIMTGYDHLCFLLAVVLWASRAWPVVKIVTAFTISHSITLSLAALQVVNIPSAWTETAIALSIIYVAIENFFTRKVEGRWRDTFLFGFVHGFGFASGLTEMGVPQRAIVPALASFNLGVEVGQIGVVMVVVPLLVLIDRLFFNGQRNLRLVQICSGVIACFGAYWLFAPPA